MSFDGNFNYIFKRNNLKVRHFCLLLITYTLFKKALFYIIDNTSSVYPFLLRNIERSNKAIDLRLNLIIGTRMRPYKLIALLIILHRKLMHYKEESKRQPLASHRLILEEYINAILNLLALIVMLQPNRESHH